MRAAPLCLGGCAVRQTVILVPDPDGRVGEAEVATAGGKQVLTKPSDMTRVGSGGAAPSAVTTADPGYVAATFAETLAVPPEKYVASRPPPSHGKGNPAVPTRAGVPEPPNRRVEVVVQ